MTCIPINCSGAATDDFLSSLVKNDNPNSTVNSDIPNQVVVWAVVDGILFLAIVSGNVLTIAAILLNRTISQVVSNQFVLSLACSDLFVGLVAPYHMMFYIEPAMGTNFRLCITRLVVVSLGCSATLFNILGIAVDRYFAIVYPLHYHKIMTKGLARKLIVAGWTLAASISTIPIYWNRWDDNFGEKGRADGRCQLTSVLAPLFIKLVYLPVFVVVYVLICGFYVKIFAETRKHARRMRQTNADSPVTWKSVQVVLLVMGSFTISYMPFVVFVLYNTISNQRTPTSSTVYKATNALAMANSAVNPVIYAWKNHEFKKALGKIVRCKVGGDGWTVPGTGPVPKIRRNLKTASVRPADKDVTPPVTNADKF